jgi:hypothetical protein
MLVLETEAEAEAEAVLREPVEQEVREEEAHLPFYSIQMEQIPILLIVILRLDF